MTDLTALLAKLCTCAGVSGDEQQAAETACRALSAYCKDAHISHGNVIGTFGSTDETAPHVLLDAHLDQVGLIVTSVTDDGFVTVGNIGGLDRRLFPVQRVFIHGEKTIPGIVCALPPHLTNGDELENVYYTSIALDTKIEYNGKEIALNDLRTAGRATRGSKIK